MNLRLEGEGPLLNPKYLSIVLNVLLWGSILFFLGSWHFQCICVTGYQRTRIYRVELGDSSMGSEIESVACAKS
jgi:hypothetical protein